jgi:uncharacterized OsmC-like protein
LSGVLEAREIPYTSLTAELEGDVETNAGPELACEGPGAEIVPLLTTTRMKWRLVVPHGKREAAEKASELGHRACAVFQTLERGIEVDPSWEIEEID